MPVINRIAAYADDMKTWRQHIHMHPELEFDCHETAAFVVERLKEFGVDEIHEGIGVTGVVAIINGQGEGPTMGLRADMDALPMQEETGAEHASRVDGVMHSCGHDGHTAMLLGAAKYLAETRNFKGRVALIFQPAEEEGGGGEAMVKDGLIENFDISQIYGIHNVPGIEFGSFYTTPGPIMAAVDSFYVNITGRGGHAAYPHECVDPIPPGLMIANGLQTIVSRNQNPLDDLVVSLSQFHAGTKENILPETAYLDGTVRTFNPELRDLVEKRMGEIVAGAGAAYGVKAELRYERGYPATVNEPEKTRFAVKVAEDVAGTDKVQGDTGREMGAEDFSYMLEKCPGSYLFLGTGDGAPLHHPKFDFNDEASPIGASFFARLVETGQPL